MEDGLFLVGKFVELICCFAPVCIGEYVGS